jgi:MSHA pilin protein MshA
MVRQRQRGFTLIELVVVIVILGILAAFAVPKFMGLEKRARIASLNAVAGTLRSSAAMTHGIYVAMGTNPANVVVEGQNVAMVNGYPSRTNLTRLFQDTSGFTYTAATGRFVPIGATDATKCFVTYNNATGVNAPYTITFGPNNRTTSALAEADLRDNC